MLKWLVGGLAITGCACALGCNRGDISSEGKILHVVTWHPVENAPPDKLRAAEGAISTIPSKAPTMERFEWGRVDEDDAPSHLLLVLFNDPQSAFERSYQRAVNEAAGRHDETGPYIRLGNAETYLVHNATPNVRSTTDGCLRRLQRITLRDATSEEMRKLEDEIAALPKEIPAIERLEWGTRTNYDPVKRNPFDPAYRNGSYFLLFTFKSTRTRDECLAHPAYKKFQSWLKQGALEFISQVEYVARGA